MKGTDSKDKVITIIKNIIQKDQNKATDILMDRLGNKLGRADIYSILDTTNLKELDIIVLLWVYSAFSDFYKIDNIKTYFTDIEIKKAENYHINRKNTSFPLTFENVTKINDGEEFKFIISVQELSSLMGSGAIKLVEGMQRESVTSMYNNKIVSHVAYNDNKAREIGENILNREYHPKDDISIHLVTDGEEDYRYDGNMLVIKSGNLALLDGQHREAGIEYALMQDRNINMQQSIYFTIGTVEMAQNIIAQHEKQTPIKKSTIEAYANSDGKLIFTRFSLNPTISKYYKFVDNHDTVVKGFGIATTADIIKAINKHYGNRLSKLKERNDITNWLVEFFTELIYLYEDDLIDFKSVRKTKWNVRWYAFPCYIYLSSYLYQKDDWKEQMVSILNKIDFTVVPDGNSYNIKSKNAIKILNNAIESSE
jgi:hypothetical protein